MKNQFSLVAFCILAITMIGCNEDDENGTELAKIHITLEVTDPFIAQSDNNQRSNVNWACLVIDSLRKACVYYYNGEVQLDRNITAEALEYAPGILDEFTYVSPGSTFVDLDDGPRNYGYFSGVFLDQTGGALYVPMTGSGQLALEDTTSAFSFGGTKHWVITFDTDTIPSYELVE